MRAALVTVLILIAGIVGLLAQTGPGTLNIYYIDTEGGQSTLFVGPTGESLLVDTGNAGDRDLGRIVETLKTAGVKQIDHMWTTHYHGDHVGSLLALAKQIPIMHFYDHGKPHPNDRIVSAAFLSSYDELSQGKRTIVKPGDKVKMTGLDITAVASANQFIRSNLSGGGKQNAACTGVPKKDEAAYTDPDNGESAGFVLAYGRFRTVDLGDLTWNGELDLMCPTNRIGTVDLYLTSHHGLAKSDSPALVHALQPRVAVMNNGTRKGGEPDRVPRALRIAGSRGSLAVALVLQRGTREQPGNVRGKRGGQRNDRRSVSATAAGGASRRRRRRRCGTFARLLDQGLRSAGRHVYSHQHAQQFQQDLQPRP